MRIQNLRMDGQTPLPGTDRKYFDFIGDRKDRVLLNTEWNNSDPGQKEPGILRQLNMLHFHGVEVFVDAAKRELERVGNGLLGCFSHAASQQFFRYFDDIPSTERDLFFQPARIKSPYNLPSFAEFIGRQFQTVGQFSSCA